MSQDDQRAPRKQAEPVRKVTAANVEKPVRAVKKAEKAPLLKKAPAEPTPVEKPAMMAAAPVAEVPAAEPVASKKKAKKAKAAPKEEEVTQPVEVKQAPIKEE